MIKLSSSIAFVKVYKNECTTQYQQQCSQKYKEEVEYYTETECNTDYKEVTKFLYVDDVMTIVDISCMKMINITGPVMEP